MREPDERAAYFLDHPGRGGPFGALMDEYARAAADFCDVLERVPVAVFDEERESDDPDTVSVRAIAAHVVGASRRYADYIRKARGLPYEDRHVVAPDALAGPQDVRPRLAEALRYTEGALEALYDAGADDLAGLTFPVRWGPIYDPEMLLEHAIVHLLRHRRQIERW